MDKVNDGGWTPGEWGVALGKRTCVVRLGVTSGPLAVCDYGNGPTEIANAKLMAAAPKMYAALAEVEDYLADRSDVVDGDYGQPSPNEEMTLLRTVRAALSKARGAQ